MDRYADHRAMNAASSTWQGADRYAVDQQMAPFRLQRTVPSDKGALNDALATGAFTGSTYAGLDPMQMRGITGMGAFGDRRTWPRLVIHGPGMGFAQNAQDIFNRTQGRTLDDAVNYATSSPQADAMVDAAMRDSTRRLKEQTLPGIGLAGIRQRQQATTRAGMNEAIAQRAYDDRRADVSTTTSDRDLTISSSARADQTSTT